MKGKKIAVAMSGGVDSTVTAALMLKEGFEVRGFFMALAQTDLAAQIERVRKSADFLGVELTVIDLAAEFSRHVLTYFEESYVAGLTPNPCVLCNRLVKCGRLLAAVLENGCDLLATGHYARIEPDATGVFRLLKGRDQKKDQSYFLNQLTQAQLARLRFPLGESTKEEIYKVAAELGLTFTPAEESQDICFLKTSVGEYLAGRGVIVPGPGDIVTLDGRKIGSHPGIHCFTVGQRRGLGIPDSTPYYVVGLDPDTNRLLVGKEEDLWRRELLIGQLNWTAGIVPDLPGRFQVKIRYRHQPAQAMVEKLDQDTLIIRFAEPQRAVTPGQFAVIYQDEEVVGGGRITPRAGKEFS